MGTVAAYISQQAGFCGSAGHWRWAGLVYGFCYHDWWLAVRPVLGPSSDAWRTKNTSPYLVG